VGSVVTIPAADILLETCALVARREARSSEKLSHLETCTLKIHEATSLLSPCLHSGPSSCVNFFCTALLTQDQARLMGIGWPGSRPGSRHLQQDTHQREHFRPKSSSDGLNSCGTRVGKAVTNYCHPLLCRHHRKRACNQGLVWISTKSCRNSDTSPVRQPCES
jgi:hypothetical protein